MAARPERRLAGLTAAWLFLVAGALTLTTPFLAEESVRSLPVLVGLGLASIAVGLVSRFVPWDHWHPRATLLLVPVALASLVIGNRFGSVSPYVYGVFYVVIFCWVGLFHPRWTSVRLAPLAAFAYVLPALLQDPVDGLALTSVFNTISVSVVLGEVIARTVAQRATAQQQYQSLVEGSPQGIAVQQGDRLCYVNPAGVALLGARDVDEVVSRRAIELVHPEDRPGAAARIRAADDGRPSEAVEGRLVRLDGRVIEVELGAVPITYERRPATLLMVQDVSDRKRAERDLAHQALHDALTGLPNRSLFQDRLSQALARMDRSSSLLAVLFVDLDRFKVINDSLGHDAGDRLLVISAQRLFSALRPADTVARFGGDEFVVLCEELEDVTEATRLAQRLADALAEPVVEGAEELRVAASIGIAVATSSQPTPEELLRDADAAMYRAKDRGRGRFEIFDEAMRARAMGRLQIENGLHRALQHDELRVFYQPVVSVSTERIVGTEALVRWEHPDRGLLEPAEFIGVAEECGLIIPLGAWVLEQACRQAQRWNTPPGGVLEVAVNLSSRQLLQPDLVEQVQAMVSESGVDPELMHMCLEITESAMMDDAVVTMRTLERLRELGVRIAVDDFGTGYSSLAYLSRFPVDVLKIDRSFVAGLGERDQSRAIVASIVELGHALGLEVVAEGVETDEQLLLLREVGCDLAQGFLLARPQPADLVTELLGRQTAGLRA